MVTTDEIREAAKQLGVAHHPVCVHCSLRSHGQVAGGAATILEGLLAEGCTVMVPAFTDRFLVAPPPDQRPARNGWDYSHDSIVDDGTECIYSPENEDIDRDMGALSATVIARPGRLRGNHALNSFAAIGPLADRLIDQQRPLDVYSPLRELVLTDGFIILMGVGAERMTFIHLAEMLAGRQLFRRWAKVADGRPMMHQTGGCSEGFVNLEPVISPYSLEIHVGQSTWRAFPAASTIEALTDAIRRQPALTHCGDPECRCEDAIKGGPMLLDPEPRGR